MCIIFLLYQVHPTYPLIIASNRDEFLDRPTESMKLRSSSSNDHPTTSSSETTAISSKDNHCQGQQQQRRRRSSLAGKDLVCGGTWLALDVTSLNIDLDDNYDRTTNSTCLEPEKDKTHNQASKHKSSTTTTTPSSSSLRWIAITNYREQEQHGRPSRGGLVTEYISSQSSAQSFVKELQQKGHEYNGFNFLVGDDMGIYYYGNRHVEQGGEASKSRDDGHDDNTTSTTAESSTKQPQRLTPGRIYGLCNAVLDTPWPKVQRGKELLEQLLYNEQQQQIIMSNNTSNNNNSSSSSLKQFHERLMTILSDTTQPTHDNELPQTGISLYSERHLSSIFVPVDKFMGKDYGTRTSTSIVVDVDGRVSVLERSWNGEEEVVDEWFRLRNELIMNDDGIV